MQSVVEGGRGSVPRAVRDHAYLDCIGERARITWVGELFDAMDRIERAA